MSRPADLPRSARTSDPISTLRALVDDAYGMASQLTRFR